MIEKNRKDEFKEIKDAVLEEQFVSEIHEEDELFRTNYFTTCPSCSSFFTLNPISENVYQCSLCKVEFTKEKIQFITELSFEATRYGWQYMKVYRSDFKKYGKIQQKYQLPPPDPLLILLASIIIGGIIEGLSYDAFKKFIKFLRSSLAGKSKTTSSKMKIFEMQNKIIENEKLYEQLDNMDDEEIDEFYHSITQYCMRKLVEDLGSTLLDLSVANNKTTAQIQALLLVYLKKNGSVPLADILKLFPNQEKNYIIKDCLGQLKAKLFIEIQDFGIYILIKPTFNELFSLQKERVEKIINNANSIPFDNFFR